jgi:hypothetical protein
MRGKLLFIPLTAALAFGQSADQPMKLGARCAILKSSLFVP